MLRPPRAESRSSATFGPSSSRLRSVLRRIAPAARYSAKSVPAVPDFDRCSDDAHRWPGGSRARRSQQFPTSIGAQTRPSQRIAPLLLGPSSSRLRSVLRLLAFKGEKSPAERVPAVPDFDRCSDRGSAFLLGAFSSSPSSSRLRSVLRRGSMPSYRRRDLRPSSSRLRSVLRPGESVGFYCRTSVPAVPDFDRCSDSPKGRQEE